MTTLVVLSSFPKLRRMEWSSYSFRIAAANISSVHEPSKTIEEIRLTIYDRNNKGYEEENDYCTVIDKALAGDNFPSLRLVALLKGIPWDYFPILQSRNLLKVWRY